MYEALQVASADGNRCPQVTHGAVVFMPADLLFSFPSSFFKSIFISTLSDILYMRLESKFL